MSANVRPAYVTIKNWKTWQHYKDREPPWVKLHSRVLNDDAFMGLTEAYQWQLVRIWLVAARSSKYTLDGDKRRTPVLSCKEATIRRAIGTTRRVPIDLFIAEGWLIPVDSSAVFNYTEGDETLDGRKHGASTTQATLDSTLLGSEKTEKTEELPPQQQGYKSTSSTTEASYAETDNPEDPAAAVEAPTESDIREACTRFRADLNIVEPIARQLPGAIFAAVVTKHAAKVKRGSVDDIPALFVRLLQAEFKEQAKTIAKQPRPMPPTRLPENERPKTVAGEEWVRHIVPTLRRHEWDRVWQLVLERADSEGWTDNERIDRLAIARELHQAEAA